MTKGKDKARPLRCLTPRTSSTMTGKSTPTDEAFAPPPDGYEAILDDEGNDTGYRRELATGTIVTFDEGEEP